MRAIKRRCRRQPATWRVVSALGAMGWTTLWAASCAQPSVDEPPRAELPAQGITGAQLARSGYGEDPYQIGGSWYEYDGRTHSVTPREAVFVWRDEAGQPQALWQIVSYYDDRGESGVFTLAWRGRQDQGWGQTRTIRLMGNVKKDGPACLDLAAGQQQPCALDSARPLAVFRTSWRPIPEAGFAVNNPSVFLTTHFTRAQGSLAALSAPSVEAVTQTMEELGALEARKSSDQEPDHSRVGWLHAGPGLEPRRHTHLQLTSSMHVAQWRVEAMTQDEAAITLTLSAWCQQASHPMAQPFPTERPQGGQITLRADVPYSAALVRLCAPDDLAKPEIKVIQEGQSPWAGLWPSEREFNLIVEQHMGRVAARPAAGQLVWNWTLAQLPEEELDGPIDPIMAPVPSARIWEGLTP